MSNLVGINKDDPKSAKLMIYIWSPSHFFEIIHVC